MNLSFLNKLFSAYELYADPKSDIQLETVTQVVFQNKKETQEKMSSAERFKKAFSYKNVKVHFVGAWYVVFTQVLSACLRKWKLSGTLFLQSE